MDEAKGAHPGQVDATHMSENWLTMLYRETPAKVDVLVCAVMKDGAASDMFGNMQSPGIHEEEQF